MKFLLLLSIATLFTGSSAVETTDNDNRQLQWNPNCGTASLWHPNYSGGWTGGFCSQQVTCNSPSYDSAADCCNAAYAGQSSYACYTAAGIPVPAPPAPPAPVPGAPAAGTWYPDYNAGWDAGKCIDTLPLPAYGSRPLYATQLECCKLAYAGQTNNFCIANMVNPPTASPSVSPTSKPTASPTTSSPSKAPTEAPTSSPSKAPTTKAPTTASPSKAPTFAPTSSPSKAPTTKAPTTASPSKAPTAAPTASPSKAPTTKSPTATPTTGSPTVTQYGSQWYPKYDAAGTCTAKLPLPPPGSRSYFASKEECCQGTYATWGPPKAANCISGSTV